MMVHCRYAFQYRTVDGYIYIYIYTMHIYIYNKDRPFSVMVHCRYAFQYRTVDVIYYIHIYAAALRSSLPYECVLQVCIPVQDGGRV
jgi:hypothetical protein